MEGKMIEELAKRDASLRWFKLGEGEDMKGEYCLEISFDDNLDLSFIKRLKRSLPYEKYDKLYVYGFDDTAILSFTGVEKDTDGD